MAESDRSITFTKLMSNTSEWLGSGYKSTTGDGLSSDEVSKLGRTINDGVDQVLLPPPVPGYGVWKWSFLTPRTTLYAFASTGGTTSAIPSTTITSATAIFYDTMIGRTISFTTSGTEYTITDTNGTSNTAGTTCDVSVDASAEGSGVAFTVVADGNYRLPDDFGGINGNIDFTSSTWRRSITGGTDQNISEYRSGSTLTGPPTISSIIPIVHAASTTEGQRFELRLWPTPASDYTLTYSYRAIPQTLSTANEYPAGGSFMSDVYKKSCLDVAEAQDEDSQGVMHARFMTALASAVQFDASENQPRNLGYNEGDGEDSVAFRRTNSVTYNGVQY